MTDCNTMHNIVLILLQGTKRRKKVGTTTMVCNPSTSVWNRAAPYWRRLMQRTVRQLSNWKRCILVVISQLYI